MAESTLKNLVPQLGRSSPYFKGAPNGKGGCSAPKSKFRTKTMILNFVHIPDVVVSFKSWIFLIFVTHIRISSSPVRSIQRRLLPYPAITSKMEICISWEDKQVSCFMPPANLFLAHYGLHYCIESPFRRIQISRDFSFLNFHLQSKNRHPHYVKQT